VRKVVLYHLASMDGVALEDGDWFDDGSPELFDNLGRIIGSQDDVLLGRGTYDYWVGYWTKSDMQPFSQFINSTRKHVFTSGEPAEEWANSTLVRVPAAEYVAELKKTQGRDIGLHGSIELTRSLLRAGLVDELRLVVAPCAVGKGRRLFDGDFLQKLELLDHRSSPKGTLFLGYKCLT
jgi:dihydrofolate reductase